LDRIWFGVIGVGPMRFTAHPARAHRAGLHEAGRAIGIDADGDGNAAGDVEGAVIDLVQLRLAVVAGTGARARPSV
jgi:hypothetical protein